MLELKESETSFSLLTENTATCIDRLTSAGLYLPADSRPITSTRLTTQQRQSQRVPVSVTVISDEETSALQRTECSEWDLWWPTGGTAAAAQFYLVILDS